MRELLVIIGYGLIYFFQIILVMVIFLGGLYLLRAFVELLASIIPGWLALSMPSLLILACLFSICGGNAREGNNRKN